MLDGMTLREAAQTPDTIKGWDKKGVPKNAATFVASATRGAAARILESQPADSRQQFPDAVASLVSLHGCAGRSAKYRAARRANQWDIVHMMMTASRFSEAKSPRRIAEDHEACAIILLAHYVGDIHQPLHVGAQYFDQSGHKVNPDLGKPALEDQGGNTILLDIRAGIRTSPKMQLWDGDPVSAVSERHGGVGKRRAKRADGRG
jgi:hypothetical protein